MINIENQHQGSTSPMNTEYETVLTGLREFKDRNLPQLGRGETGEMVKTTPTTPVATGPRMAGIVKWFNPTKGFGFITPSSGGLDVFVHQSEIQLPGFRSLAQGEPVEYQLYDGQKGPKALKVTGPQGKLVKGAPRQTKKQEKPLPPLTPMTERNSPVLQPNLLKFAGNSTFVLANQMPVSTPVLAPTQALNALPSMISTPTPASPQVSHFYVTQQGLQNFYTPAIATEFPSFTSEIPTVTTMPMSPTPMMIESMPMSPQPHYVPMTPLTPVNTYTTATTTPTPFTFPNQTKQMLVSSPPTPVTSGTATTMDYSYATASFFQPENPYDQTPFSFYKEDSHMLTSPMSPIHC